MGVVRINNEVLPPFEKHQIVKHQNPKLSKPINNYLCHPVKMAFNQFEPQI